MWVHWIHEVLMLPVWDVGAILVAAWEEGPQLWFPLCFSVVNAAVDIKQEISLSKIHDFFFFLVLGMKPGPYAC
jgi:hypothetical protein